MNGPTTKTARGAHLAWALLLILPAFAAANGGSSGYDQATSNAMAGGDGGALSRTELVPEDDVECMSEDLSIDLGDEVRVQVDYVFVNRGATKALAYAFPFALAEQADLLDGRVVETKRFGEPTAFSMEVNGKIVGAEKRPGGEVPPRIPVPAIEDGTWGGWDPEDDATAQPVRTTKATYHWSYRVSRVEFPAGQPVKLRVRYRMPYLVYTKSSELGRAQSPGEFSYLLSTGGGWRGRAIGKLRVRIMSPERSAGQIQVAGLPFSRTRAGWTYEAEGFQPTVEKNLVVRRSEFASIPLSARDGDLAQVLSPNGWASWTSPPVGGPRPVAIELLTPDPRETGTSEDGAYAAWSASASKDTGRYRLKLSTAKDLAQPARIRVRLWFASGTEDVFRATFAPADPADVAAEGGWRSIWFDAAKRPLSITLTLEEVVPGANGSRSVRFTGIALEADVSNYTAYVPTPR